MQKTVGLLNQEYSIKNATFTFSIAASQNGIPSSFIEKIRSIDGVTEVSEEKHQVGKGYWIEITISSESFQATRNRIRNYIEEIDAEDTYCVIDWLTEKHWSADWFQN